MFEKLDSRTFSYIFVWIQFFYMLTFFIATIDSEEQSMKKLTLGIFVTTFGALLVSLHEMYFGIFIYLANSLIILGYIIFTIGILELLGYNQRRKEIMIIFGIHLIIHIKVTLITPDYILRTAMFSFSTLILSIYIGMIFFKFFLKSKYYIALLSLITCILYGFFHLLRIAVLFQELEAEAFFTGDSMVKYVYLITVIYNIILYTAPILLLTKLSAEKLLEINNSLEELAMVDYLTKAYNLHYLIKNLKLELEKIILHRRKACLIMIDLDFFKKINDRYGHLVGDEVLVKISEIFKQNLRIIDIFGRYGGEEFLIILPELELEDARNKIENIQNIVRNIKWIQEGLKVTFSAGILEINAKNCFKEEKLLINEVDKLLYQAKQNGRDRIESVLE